jgi:hypothetical protein
MGEKLQNLKPREATCPAKPWQSWKPFTRAKWEIRFQRFALSFRPSALGHCRFHFPLAFSLQPLAFQFLPLAFAGALVADVRANEKFHLSPACDGEARKFQWSSFQKGNDLGRMRSRSDGRCLFKKETFPSHGCHSVERQQGH